ncbi:hypothetical protein [Streptomyces sp. NPDC055036]
MFAPNPAAPEGEAIIDLYEQMTDLKVRTGEWPGADSACVLSRRDRHEDEAKLWSDEDSALVCRARHVRRSWDNVRGDDGIPEHPPLDDRMAVDLYYGPKAERSDEDYSLYADAIGRFALGVGCAPSLLSG